MDFYVYEHRRASDGATFYVGKGRKKRAFVKTNRSPYWNNIAKKHGFVVHFVKMNMTEQEAFVLERQLITDYGRANLCNMTDGGDGASNPSPETREKMRSAKLGQHGYWNGKKRDSETLKKMSDGIKGERHPRWGLRGELNPLYGRKHTEEHKKKISEGNKNKIVSATARARLSAAKSGKGHHMFDHKIYTFRHESGGSWSGTQFDFRREFGFQQSAVRRMVKGERKSPLFGWTSP